MRGVRVFELDLPQTQDYKKKRVREVFGALPDHVTHVSIDFAKQTLELVLNAAGFDQKKKTIFIWEGVTMSPPGGGDRRDTARRCAEQRAWQPDCL